MRERHVSQPDIEVCEFFETLERAGPDAKLEAGVYTLEDMRTLGRKAKWCPYFLARHMMAFANVVVYNYQYMLDPKVCKRPVRVGAIYSLFASKSPPPPRGANLDVFQGNGGSNSICKGYGSGLLGW